MEPTKLKTRSREILSGDPTEEPLSKSLLEMNWEELVNFLQDRSVPPEEEDFYEEL